MANNHRRLIAEADMLSVINHKGYKTTKKGIYTFLYCPVHESCYEGTNHPQSNCYTKEGQNFCYCSVCDRKFNAKDYLENKENISFGEAYDELYEIMGCPSYYKDNGRKKKKTKAQIEAEKKFAEDEKFTGLKMNFYQSDKYLMGEEKRIFMSSVRNVIERRKLETKELLREISERDK